MGRVSVEAVLEKIAAIIPVTPVALACAALCVLLPPGARGLKIATRLNVSEAEVA